MSIRAHITLLIILLAMVFAGIGYAEPTNSITCTEQELISMYEPPPTNHMTWTTNCLSVPCSPYELEVMQDSGEMEDIVKRLAEAGEICKVFGHQWRGGRPGEGEGSAYGGWYADYHPNTSYRTCRICGECESQTREWK